MNARSSAIVVSMSMIFAATGFGQSVDLSTRKLSEHVYLVSGAGGNVTVLVTTAGVLVVDAGNRRLGDRVASAIRTVASLPVRYLVYTHYHDDHWSGAWAFPRPILVVSHDRTRAEIAEFYQSTAADLTRRVAALEEKVRTLGSSGDASSVSTQKELEEARAARDVYRRHEPVLPEFTFNDRLTIHLGDQVVDLMYLGPAHTDGDIIAYFPREKVLHLGDLLYTNGWVPRLDADAGASADNWLEIFDRVMSIDARTYVPGHGDVQDREGVRKHIGFAAGYLRELKTEVGKLFRDGVPLDEVKRRVRMPAYETSDMNKMLLPYNIDGVYRELERRKAAGKWVALVPSRPGEPAVAAPLDSVPASALL